MHRRDVITLLGGAAAVPSSFWPRAGRAQPQAGVPTIGYLSLGLPAVFEERLKAFRQALAETGFVEGRNVAIEYRWAGDDADRLPALAADLVRRQVAVIAAFGGSNGALAAKAATSTIPIVFGIGGDPVAAGFVASFRQPDRNLTGATTLGVDVTPKRVELMHELVPRGRIAALVNPASGNAAVPDIIQNAARTLGRELQLLHASNEREIDAAFAGLKGLPAAALVIGIDPYFNSRARQFGALTLRYGVPTIYQYRDFVAAGGLMSYGSAITDTYRVAGQYVGRILKGEKPAELPVQQASRIELILNMTTAKALGLTFPLTLLGRADEVIE